MSDGAAIPPTRSSAPSAERNKEPILAVLRTILPATGLVLEIASGTGQHVAHFASALPHLVWQPTERDARQSESIAAWIADPPLPNVLPPLELDVQHRPWPVDSAVAIVCINMIHISPWPATCALLAGAGEC